jgi:hypothetical protein
MRTVFRQTDTVYLRLIVLWISCILGLATLAGAGITGVEVVPGSPTVNDSVTVTLSGEFFDGCWHPGSGQCGTVEEFLINPSIYVIDVWEPGAICPMVIVDYSFSCEYGRLGAGHYVVSFTEEHESLREPAPDVLVVEFDVVVPTAIEATINIDPRTLNLWSKGEHLTCYIELPPGYDPEDIDVSTVLFNDVVEAMPWPTDVGDHDLDGTPDRMVKFSRGEVSALLGEQSLRQALRGTRVHSGSSGGEIADMEVAISGELSDGTLFAGADVIRVIDPRAGGSGSSGLQVSSTPVGATALISFDLDGPGPASVLVYDAAGRLVRTLVDEEMIAGGRDVIWDGRTEDGQAVSAGFYFVRVAQRGGTSLHKVLLLR